MGEWRCENVWKGKILWGVDGSIGVRKGSEGFRGWLYGEVSDGRGPSLRDFNR